MPRRADSVRVLLVFLYKLPSSVPETRFTNVRSVSGAKGSLLAFLDADDLWTSNKLELQINALKDDHKLDIVFGNVYTQWGDIEYQKVSDIITSMFGN